VSREPIYEITTNVRAFFENKNNADEILTVLFLKPESHSHVRFELKDIDTEATDLIFSIQGAVNDAEDLKEGEEKVVSEGQFKVLAAHHNNKIFFEIIKNGFGIVFSENEVSELLEALRKLKKSRFY